MGRQFFVIEEKVLMNSFLLYPYLFIFTSSTSALKNKSKCRALFSECGGAYERLLWYGWGWEGKKSLYTHYKKQDYTTGYGISSAHSCTSFTHCPSTLFICSPRGYTLPLFLVQLTFPLASKSSLAIWFMLAAIWIISPSPAPRFPPSTHFFPP